MGELRIGTSGWNYPSGHGTWNGVFYPPARGRAKSFDELAFYAEHFNTVEVNATFYGQPRANVCRRWAERTPAGFEFSVKLFQKFTHPKMFEASLRRTLRAPEAPAAAFRELARPNAADLDEFKRGIEPLAAAGKLGAVLAQFPPSFRSAPAEQDYLSHLLRSLSDYALAVEVRHSSWSDDFSGTLGLLNGARAAWVQIDEPQFRFSIQQNRLPNVKGFYYMRLHGRNAAQWWSHEAAEDRYNYLYSSDELREFSETAGAATQLVKKVYLYTNNHFSAKAVANAAMIKQQLGEPLTGDYPPAFVAQFPDLADVVRAQTSEFSLVPSPGPSRTPASRNAT